MPFIILVLVLIFGGLFSIFLIGGCFFEDIFEDNRQSWILGTIVAIAILAIVGMWLYEGNRLHLLHTVGTYKVEVLKATTKTIAVIDTEDGIINVSGFFNQIPKAGDLVEVKKYPDYCAGINFLDEGRKFYFLKDKNERTLGNSSADNDGRQ